MPLTTSNLPALIALGAACALLWGPRAQAQDASEIVDWEAIGFADGPCANVAERVPSKTGWRCPKGTKYDGESCVPHGKQRPEDTFIDPGTGRRTSYTVGRYRCAMGALVGKANFWWRDEAGQLHSRGTYEMNAPIGGHTLALEGQVLRAACFVKVPIEGEDDWESDERWTLSVELPDPWDGRWTKALLEQSRRVGLAADDCPEITSHYCALHAGCRDEGLCTLSGDTCHAASDADCRASWACREENRCATLKGACVTADQANPCLSTTGCLNDGACTPRGGACVVASDADCQRSGACERAGQCTARRGRCVASVRSDCAKACKRAGLCKVSGGVCVATDKGCRGSQLCTFHGRCGLVDGECAATQAADCRASHDCQTAGYCLLGEGRCQEPKLSPRSLEARVRRVLMAYLARDVQGVLPVIVPAARGRLEGLLKPGSGAYRRFFLPPEKRHRPGVSTIATSLASWARSGDKRLDIWVRDGAAMVVFGVINFDEAKVYEEEESFDDAEEAFNGLLFRLSQEGQWYFNDWRAMGSEISELFLPADHACARGYEPACRDRREPPTQRTPEPEASEAAPVEDTDAPFDDPDAPFDDPDW